MATRGNSEGGQFTYLVVKHHSLCEESKVEKEGFVEVEVFNPKTKEKQIKYIDKWGTITGFINAIEYYDTGDTYETTFRGFKINIDDEVIVDLPQKTPAYDTFCKVAENIDFSKEVSLSAYHNKKKDRTGFIVKQDGNSVEWKYTIDNPGDCPPWEKDEDGEWDSRKQRAFLKQRMLDVVIPMVDEAANVRKSSAPISTSSPVDAIIAADAASEAPKAKAATASKGKSKGAEVDSDDIPF